MFGFGFWSMTETYMERERYGADYWNIWITGLHLTIFHYLYYENKQNIQR